LVQIVTRVVLIGFLMQLVLMSAGSVAVQAAESKPLNLVTSPLPINLTARPGTTVSAEIKVKQNSGGTETLKVSLMKFGAYGEEGKPQLMDRTAADTYFDWVKFDKPTFVAPNNVWQTVKMTITLPKTAAFGYYYAVVFTRQGDDARRGANTNAINGGSAVLVLLDAFVPGAKRQVELVSVESQHNIYEFLPAMFNVKLKNSGNVHVVPKGNIFIMKGKKQVATLSLNGEQGNLLPNSNRIYQVEWTDGFPHFEKTVEDGKVKLNKDGEAIRHLVWNNGPAGSKDVKPHLRMGKYTAHVVAVYDDGTRDVPVEAEVEFWVIPWRLLIGLVVVLLLVGVGTYSLTRGTWQRVARVIRRSKR
jgi:hypothetical protein